MRLSIMPPGRGSPGRALQSIGVNRYRGNGSWRVAALLAFFLPAGCDSVPKADPNIAVACDATARLATALYGAVRLELDWTSAEIECQSMPRPDGEGARIHLSGPSGSGAASSTVAFILGIPDLEKGQTGNELGTNVTFMEEGSGRFFSTADADGCWSDIHYQEPVGDASGSIYRIGGTVYCVSPLAELNGGSAISFTELEFAGRLNWGKPE